MPSFSGTSKKRLSSCDARLVVLFNKVISNYDCIILEGHRGAEAQDEAYRRGKSTLKYPQSKHNKTPSLAVDVAPWYSEPPHIRWGDIQEFQRFGYYVRAVAEHACSDDTIIRWGGDWDRDFDLKDQNFHDLPHFELVAE